MTQPTVTTQVQASAPESDADNTLPDGDLPYRRRFYRLLLEKLHRYVASYTDLSFTPFPPATLRPIPISDAAGAAQMQWGDWAEILSSISIKSPFFFRN